MALALVVLVLVLLTEAQAAHLHGQHILADFGSIQNIELLGSAEKCEAAVLRACKAGNLTVLSVATNHFEPQGSSVVAILAESHLSLHTWPELRSAALDLFACGEYSEPRAAVDYLALAMRPERGAATVVQRRVVDQRGDGGSVGDDFPLPWAEPEVALPPHVAHPTFRCSGCSLGEFTSPERNDQAQIVFAGVSPESGLRLECYLMPGRFEQRVELCRVGPTAIYGVYAQADRGGGHELMGAMAEMLAAVPLIGSRCCEKTAGTVLLLGGEDGVVVEQLHRFAPEGWRLDWSVRDMGLRRLFVQRASESGVTAIEEEAGTWLRAMPSAQAVEVLLQATPSSYDAIVLDPIAWRAGSRARLNESAAHQQPSALLFGESISELSLLVTAAHRALRPRGVLVLPSVTAPFLDGGADLGTVVSAVRKRFAWAAPMVLEAPWREGGPAGVVVATKDGSRCERARRYGGARRIDSVYYNPQVHRRAFVLPPNLSGGGADTQPGGVGLVSAPPSSIWPPRERDAKYRELLRDSCYHVIAESESEFQETTIFWHPCLGLGLALGGVEQTTELDGFVYDEMIVHPAILGSDCCSARTRNGRGASVLIVGGGDGGTLREVMRYSGGGGGDGDTTRPLVGRVVMVELDEVVVRSCKEHLAFLGDPHAHGGGALVEVIIGDGRAYVESAAPGEWDLIIVDSGDSSDYGNEAQLRPEAAGEPVPSDVFYNDAFYGALRRALSPRGVAVMHAEMPGLYGRVGVGGGAPIPLARVVRGLRGAGGFGGVDVYGIDLALSDSGRMAMLVASKEAPLRGGVRRARHAAHYRYYTPAEHRRMYHAQNARL